MQPLQRTDNISKQTVNIIKQTVWTCLGSFATYTLADAGIAHILAMKTLTHGTGPLGYIGINLIGGQPYFGNVDTCASGFFSTKTPISSGFDLIADPDRKQVNSKLLNNVIRTITARGYAAESGAWTFGYDSHISKSALGAFFGLLTPTLKFRFTPDEITRLIKLRIFELDFDDDSYSSMKPIKADRLGITGSLKHGMNKDLPNRMIRYPGKVAFGIALLAAAALTAKKTYHLATHE